MQLRAAKKKPVFSLDHSRHSTRSYEDLRFGPFPFAKHSLESLLPSLMTDELETELRGLRDEELLAYLEPMAASAEEALDSSAAVAEVAQGMSSLKLGTVLDNVKSAMDEVCVAVQSLHPSSADSRAPATNLGSVSRSFDSVAAMLGGAATDLKGASYHMASMAAEVRKVQDSGIATYKTARLSAPRVPNRSLKTNMRYKAPCAHRPWLDVDSYKSFISRNHSEMDKKSLAYVCDASDDLAVYVQYDAFAVVMPRSGAHWMTNFSCSGVVVSCLLSDEDKENTPPHCEKLFRCLADEVDYDDAVKSVEESKPTVDVYDEPAQPLYEFFPGDLVPAENVRAHQADALAKSFRLQQSRRLTALPFATTESAFKAACCAYACEKNRAPIMEQISMADTPKQAKTAVFMCPREHFNSGLWTDRGLCKEIMRHLFATKSADYLDELEALRVIFSRHFRVPEHRVYFLEASAKDELWGCKTDHATAMDVLYDQARAGKTEAVYRYLEGLTESREEREAFGLPGRNLFGECWTDVWRHVCWKMSGCGYFDADVRRRYYMTSLDGKTGIADVPLFRAENFSDRTWECLAKILPCLKNYRVRYDYRLETVAETVAEAVGETVTEAVAETLAEAVAVEDAVVPVGSSNDSETIVIFSADQDHDSPDLAMPWLTPAALEIFRQRRDLTEEISRPLLADAVEELRRVRESIVANLDQHDPDWVWFNADYERLYRARGVIEVITEAHASLNTDAIRECMEFMRPVANFLSVLRVAMYQHDRLHVYNRLVRELRRAQSTDINGPACFVRLETPGEFEPMQRLILLC